MRRNRQQYLEPYLGNLPSQLAVFNPAVGRGYRTGNSVVVPANSVGQAATRLAEHGSVDQVRRWKITIHATDPGGKDVARSGAGLRLIAVAKMENEQIPRTCFVSVGDAQVVYAPGKSLHMVVENPNAFELTAHYQIDEYSAGLARWEDQEFFPTLVAETDLTIPTFCDSFQVFSPGAAAPAPRLRGYGPGGVLVYEEVLSVPRSGDIPRIPNVDYTLDISGPGPQRHIVLYFCNG